MVQADILKSFLDPATPQRVRLAAARGLAPLAPREMVELLVKLARDADREISEAATSTLAGWPEEQILAEVQSADCSPEILEQLSLHSSSEAVWEAAILNANTPSRAIEKLAQIVPGRLLELILYNKARILESPEILVNVKQNVSMTGEAQRLMKEIEAEFFGGKSTVYSVETQPEEKTEAAAAEAEETVPDLSSLEGLPVDPEAREMAIYEQLAKMTVPQRLRQALFGTREVRTILIRDRNREVARNVLRSPKITDQEVESFAAMRSISDEILREIGNSREWSRSYVVVQNLVKNPRTPPATSQRLMGRLQAKDLAGLVRDHGVSEAVRRNADRLLRQRLSLKKSG
jgi:hypothetical protein